MQLLINERIKSKADELFYKYGIKTVTMDEIARQLGISKKTIYLYFKDKDELVDAVFSNVLLNNCDLCEKAKVNSQNAIHEGFLAMELMEEMFQNLNPIILYDLERNHPRTFHKFQQHKYNFLYKALVENLEKGKNEGLFREELTTDVAAKLRLESMMLPFNQDVFPKNKFNLTQVQSELIEFYLFSIVTLKGYRLILKYKAQNNKKISK